MSAPQPFAACHRERGEVDVGHPSETLLFLQMQGYDEGLEDSKCARKPSGRVCDVGGGRREGGHSYGKPSVGVPAAMQLF
jgi:hypothetical protein